MNMKHTVLVTNPHRDPDNNMKYSVTLFTTGKVYIPVAYDLSTTVCSEAVKSFAFHTENCLCVCIFI